MKALCLLAIFVLFTGCHPDQEDRDFFYSGWVNPQEGSNMRMYGTKKSPEEERHQAVEPVGPIPYQPIEAQ